MTLHVLRHINTNDRLLVTKHRFRQRFGKFGFADARRAKKEKRGNRSVGLAKAGSRQTNGIADRENSIFLPNQPITQCVFHIQQLLTLLLRKLGHRNPGETGQYLGNRLQGHLKGFGACLALPGFCFLSQLRLFLTNAFFEAFGFIKTFTGGCIILFTFKLRDFGFQLLNASRP
ncbi:hypothetical protein D3C85_1116580 [compost metagenome]